MTLEDIQVNDDVEVTYRGRVIHTSLISRPETEEVRLAKLIRRASEGGPVSGRSTPERPGGCSVKDKAVGDAEVALESAKAAALRSLRDTADTYGYVVIPKDAS